MRLVECLEHNGLMNTKTTAGRGAANSDLVRAGRDGDQFHHHWAARHCLSLLPGVSDLVAISIEGASTAEGAAAVLEGDELIDVGFYYGSQQIEDARLVRYVQLKHSTKLAHEPWTASGLGKTLAGNTKRFLKLRETFSWDDLKDKLRFSFTTNRPISEKVVEALEDLASGSAPRHPTEQETLLGYAKGLGSETRNFFQLFSVEAGEPDLWNQRNLLFADVRNVLADADSDAPVQLKELVARKATSEFASNPSIEVTDVLRALSTDVDDLIPAPCLIKAPDDLLAREQEPEIRATIEGATRPIVLHADGGVGKSVMAWQLSESLPLGSVAILYDCFGDGLYRTNLHFRHRHKDALLQMANELAAQGLCLPLIPTGGSDGKRYMRAFVARLKHAVGLLRAKEPGANLYVIVDAADNAVMAAQEIGDAAFVPDLVRTPMPAGVKLVLTCRTHRKDMLEAPPDAVSVLLKPFSEAETARHLKQFYADATAAEVKEFQYLSSSNPRVQALALSRKKAMAEMLKELGPTPSTVARAIGGLLQHAVDQLKYHGGRIEADQIDLICQGLAILRPLVPIGVLAQVSGTDESAVKSFAYDLGRPLLVKGDSLHFLDEPSETWFREEFYPDQARLNEFLERLQPLAGNSAYVASTLPQLLLAAGRMDELVGLALSQDGLPSSNPLERRDIEVQRLTFALKACLVEKRYASAAKLALRVAGELAGVERQNNLIQSNTDIAAVLLSADRIEELVSRRTFGDTWMGSHHAYDAGLLSGRGEFLADARSHLRIADDWLRAWSRAPDDEREQQRIEASDIVELAMASLFTAGAKEAARFLRGWSPRHVSMEAGGLLARRLVDLGRLDYLDALAEQGASDVWLMLGLASQACEIGHALPIAPVRRLVRALAGRRIFLEGPGQFDARWVLLEGVTCAVMQALRVLPREDEKWAGVLRRYLPSEPPREFTDRYPSERSTPLRAYALEAALRSKPLTLADVVPVAIRGELDKVHHSRSSEAEAFHKGVGGVIEWFSLNAEIACGRTPSDLAGAIAKALKATDTARASDYQGIFNLDQSAARGWICVLRDASPQSGEGVSDFQRWLEEKLGALGAGILAEICRISARKAGFEGLATEVAIKAFEELESSREHAGSRADSYQSLARAIYPVNKAEAVVYFDRAVELSSRIGDENLDRWGALLSLAQATEKGAKSRPWSAYRLARGAELTYEHVARDKHFDWRSTVDSLIALCKPSTLAILSRWRDRSFGSEGRLLQLATEGLVRRGVFSPTASVSLGPMGDYWYRSEDIVRAVEAEGDSARREDIFRVGYRYLRVVGASEGGFERILGLCSKYGLDAPDLQRLLEASREHGAAKSSERTPAISVEGAQARRDPDWNVLFEGVDLSSSDQLRAAFLKLRTFDPPYQTGEFYREAARRSGLGGAADFCKALAGWPDFGNFELRALLDTFDDGKTKPVSLRRALGEAALSACRGAPEWARRSRWGSSFPYKRLINDSIVTDDEIVDATLEGFLSRLTTFDAGELFQMLEPLAHRLSADEANEALHFGLELLEEDLRPDDADGPWTEDLSPQGSCDEAMAAYLWVSLGSPSAEARWEAAHAVRAAVELNWSGVLHALARRAVDGAPGPFVDKRFDFYLWHARQWLLIALARCSLDKPESVRPFGDFLVASVRSEHVMLRHFGAFALKSLPDLCADFEPSGGVASFNAPALPITERSSYRNPVADDTAPEEPEGADGDKYYFGIDIGPYWFAPLGRVFGLSESSMEKRVARVIKEQLGVSGTSPGADPRRKSKIYDYEEMRQFKADMPRVDDLRAYGAYHGMMIVAAQLLKSHHVGKSEQNSQDDFVEWLEGRMLSRRDGRWVFDRRDPQLTKAPPKPESRSNGEWCWEVSADHLDGLLASDEGLTVVSGDWTSGESDETESISVSSALVPRELSAAFLAAAQTAVSVHHIYFPFENGDDDDEDPTDADTGVPDTTDSSHSSVHFKLLKWISTGSGPTGIDEYDPWGERLRYPGDEPDGWVKAAMGLTASEGERRWVTKSGSTMRSETWTRTSGYGREQETIPGTRLSCDREFLRELLATDQKHHLVVGLTLRRRRPRYGANANESDPYPDPYVRYYLIEEDGIARTLRRGH